MRKSSLRLWWEGVGISQPIMIGYLPVAVMFGISSRTAGLSTVDALMISALVFAGASQFALVGMVASGVSFPGALVAATVAGTLLLCGFTTAALLAGGVAGATAGACAAGGGDA